MNIKKSLKQFYFIELNYFSYIIDYLKMKKPLIIFYEMFLGLLLGILNYFYFKLEIDVYVILTFMTIILGATITSISIIITNKKSIIDSYLGAFKLTEGFKEKENEVERIEIINNLFINSMNNFYYLTIIEIITIIVSLISEFTNENLIINSILIFMVVYTIKIFLNSVNVLFLFSKRTEK
ncbi:MAG: hypothetical protein FD141_373 [Fusobacteria bacterium]|nr:MAG: hypothetical protein FD141_373 [Fusobacteriota bacterium]KAF0228962.1 MAG: hypothetical protein FD182_1218 [Fusobacteriota bacterium]